MSEESYDGSDAERIDAIESDSFRAGLDEADEKIIICPDCGSDDLRLTDVVDVDDNEQYECQDCGAFFFYDEEED